MTVRRPLTLAVYGGEGMATPELERSLFAKLRLPNGTWKTTYRNRLDDLNELLLDHLPRGRRLQLMDVAVSSGVSTLEWSEQLTANRIAHDLVAGDIAVDGWLTSLGGRVAVLFDADGGAPLLLEIGEWARAVQSDRPLAKAARPLLTPLLRGLSSVAGRRPVKLVTADLANRPGVEIVRDDVSVAGRFPSRFDVVRAANLVQPSYFDDADLRTILENLRDRVRDKGLLVVCRTTDDGENLATIFRREGDRLLAEARMNGGSEVEAIALTL
jgi:hypothetical protein